MIDELRVCFITEPRWNTSLFQKLVLAEHKKDMIEGLVRSHTQQISHNRADFVEGKGNGLTILLHGSPGTGKTFTAECVAELTRRPLYRVSGGDIGIKTETVEQQLNSVLSIGAAWGCIVLLDEADVFLEERTKLDLERNALVAVFLRVLEYYTGVLICTSDRVGTFDEAFKSRMQLTLHYPPLEREDRLQIWANFIGTLESEVSVHEYQNLRSHLQALSNYKLNGRQIRNCVNTARQFAMSKGASVGYSHLVQALQNVIEFDQYVVRLRDGFSDDEFAEHTGIRHRNKKRKSNASDG